MNIKFTLILLLCVVSLNAQRYKTLVVADKSTVLGYDYTNLLHWYDFNEGAGTTLIDLHGSDNGTNTGAYVTDSAGIEGLSYYFEESEDDYVTLTTGVNFTNVDFYIGVWVKPHQFDGNVCLLCDITTGAMAFLANGAAGLTLLVRDGSFVSTSTLTMNVFEWNYVGVSLNSATNQATFYCNGNTEVEAFSYAFSAVSQGIGGDGSAYSYDGLFDDMQIFGRTVSIAEMNYYYNSGNGRTYEE